MSLRERNKQRTRDNILAAAFSLLEEKDYDQITMDMIAEKAEVSRATLFNYFPTKEGLFLVFAQQTLQTQIRPRVLQYLSTDPTLIEAFDFLFMTIYEQVFAVPHLGRAIKYQAFLQPISQASPDEADDYIKMIGLLLAYGREKGEIHTDIPAEKQVSFVASLYIALFYGLVFPVSVADYQGETASLLRFISDGLRFKAHK